MEKQKNIIIKPSLVEMKDRDLISWDEWLVAIYAELKALGYHRYTQNHRSEDFSYWKNFWIDGQRAYQIGLLFYDFRKYAGRLDTPDRIGVQFECLFVEIDARIDLSVSKDITLTQFEEMARHFYDSMLKYSR